MENIEIEELKYIIGMRVIDAREYLDEEELECRIISEDGITYILTKDIKDDRINVEVINDIVIKIDGVY